MQHPETNYNGTIVKIQWKVPSQQALNKQVMGIHICNGFLEEQFVGLGDFSLWNCAISLYVRRDF